MSASESITITVKEVNAAPVLAAIGDKAVDELSELTFAATASDPNDAPPNRVTLSASGLPIGASFDPASGVFLWRPSEAQGPGSYVVTFTATDDGSPPLSANETITITVNEVNSAPVLAAIGNQRVSANETLTFTVSGSDPNDVPPNELVFTATDLPPGAVFDPLARLFSWQPGTDQVGDHTVTFRATDDGTPPLSASETITITVAAPPAPVQLVGVDVSGGLFKFAWRTEAGRRYRIQTKNNLSDPEWTDGPEVTGEGEFSEPISLDGQRYYRVKAE
ncbi:MAG: putative Ig domain-containing protein [Verrucomicrobia bacterium]|nr:putative Ig domain-containing protein [Verrucomicrobiota bacterium]